MDISAGVRSVWPESPVAVWTSLLKTCIVNLTSSQSACASTSAVCMAKFGVCSKKPSAFVRVQHQIEQTNFQESEVRFSQPSMYGRNYQQAVPNVVNFLYNVVAVVVVAVVVTVVVAVVVVVVVVVVAVVVAEVLSSVSEECFDILVPIRL